MNQAEVVTLTIAGTLIWLLAAAATYELGRALCRHDKIPWRRADQAFFIGMGLIGGPLALMALAGMYGFIRLADCQWGQEPASW